MSEERKDEERKDDGLEEEVGEKKAALQALMEEGDPGVSDAETEEEKAARLAAEQSGETDEEREAREKAEAEAAEAERLAGLSEEERTAEEQKAREEAEKAAAEKEAEEERLAAEERERNKGSAHLRHKVKRLEERLAQYEKKPRPSGEAVEDTVSKFVKALESGGDENTHLARLRNAGSKDLVAIHQKAASGEYGEYCNEVIDAVSRLLPVAQAREAQEFDAEKARIEAAKKNMENERKQALSDFPEFADEESAAAKSLKRFMSDLIGTLDPKTGDMDDGGALPEELSLYLHTHPYALHQIVNHAHGVLQTNARAATEKENLLSAEVAKLKEELAKYKGLGTPSGAGQETEKPGKGAAKTRLKNMMAEE